MKERPTKKTFIIATYSIHPYDKWVLVSDLLEEVAKLELRQLFLGSQINKQLEKAPDGVPPIAKALEMEINSERIEELTNMIDRMDGKRQGND